ncbi:MAG: UDP-4-amino-4,6-dideoxy-N-acetyl-beta-L-altrosamine transaminase, partial [candidate division Zixibacteria bacterium]|nr:UDP-4-amino-4,6-dideoxy-N-acetyl-beta-L-altrosamine transaminase [candidate division Zixibacteria bacterium]
DVEAVVSALRSDYLTQGPLVERFERALSSTVGARDTVVCANGTAALHLAMLALNIRPGDEVVTSAITFVADANCARYVGAEVKFCDVDPDTGLMMPERLAAILDRDRQKKIKVVIPVDFAGQPADVGAISALARAHGAYVVEDACHALGADYSDHGRRNAVGGNGSSDLTVFSFHPVKHITTGEGGAITTADSFLGSRLRQFRTHGITRQEFIHEEMAVSTAGEPNPWYYEVTELGFNYRMNDLQAALGLSQLGRLGDFIARRREIANMYDQLLASAFDPDVVRPLTVQPGVGHAYHLYVVRIDFGSFGRTRAKVMNKLLGRDIGTQVHYIPLHLQPYYRDRYGLRPGMFPNAENYYANALSLPMYPGLTNQDIERVVGELESILLNG